MADGWVSLPGSGPTAYLDIEMIVGIAKERGCTHLHPGTGFLSENPALAQACEEAGIVFVGPPSAVLELFGDKIQVRRGRL